MKQIGKKLAALLLCLILTAGMMAVAASAENAAPDPDATGYRGTYYYRPGAGEYFELYDNVDYYVYTDDYFKKSSREFDEHLATMSMCLAEASVSSTREPFTPEGYARKSRDAVALLDDLGFSDIEINEAYTLKPTKDSMGAACARKRITVGSDEYTLLVILPRSAGYEAEWGNNFVLGAEGDAKGFSDAAIKCLDYAKGYVADHAISGDIKVWCVGYSRGAAASNLLAKNLVDNPQKYLGSSIRLTPENLYCYNYGTPMAGDRKNDTKNDRYAGIFNFYAKSELASVMAPVEMGFSRYGTDIHLTDMERFDVMLDNLYICTPYIHEMYVNEMNSTLYYPKRIGLVDGSLGIVNDDVSYMPYEASEYLAGFMTYLDRISGGRANYHAVYEQGFSDLISYYESLTGASSSAFTEALTSNEKTVYLLAAMYAYFMKMKDPDNIVIDTSRVSETALELAALVAAIGEVSGESNTAAAARAAANLALYLLMTPEDIRSIAAVFLGDVLREAMTASGASEEQLAAFRNQEDLESLVHILSHLILGNIWQSDSVEPLNPDNEQIKAAATLIGNAGCLFADHTNEVIKSWLRLDDSYFADYSSLSDAQLAGYRRVAITNASTLNAIVTDSSNAVVATIRDGVLDNSADKWIGFTNTDDGGFFRFPLDESYTITYSVNAGCEAGVRVSEYSVDTAAATFVFGDTATALGDTVATINLPALDEGYAIPSSTRYSFSLLDVPAAGYLLGDADGDGAVTILDATAIQRTLVSLPVKAFVEKAADVDRDGVSILDATRIQRFLAEIDNPYDIGSFIADSSA